MKLSSALILTALLGASSAFAAQSSNASTTPTSTHSSKSTSSKACNKQADEKKLTGDARTSFVKECRAGKAEAK